MKAIWRRKEYNNVWSESTITSEVEILSYICSNNNKVLAICKYINEIKAIPIEELTFGS